MSEQIPSPTFKEGDLVLYKGFTYAIKTLSICGRYALVTKGYRQGGRQHVKTSNLRIITNQRAKWNTPPSLKVTT